MGMMVEEEEEEEEEVVRHVHECPPECTRTRGAGHSWLEGTYPHSRNTRVLYSGVTPIHGCLTHPTIARGVERCMMLPTGGAWEVMGWMEGNGGRFGVWRLIRGLTPRDLTASVNAPTLKRKSNTYKIHHVASRRRGGPYPPPRSSSTLNSAAGRIRPIDLIAVAIVYRVLPVCGAYASRSSCWLLSFPWRRLKVVSWSSNADSKSSANADVADSESSNSSIVADVKSSDGKGETLKKIEIKLVKIRKNASVHPGVCQWVLAAQRQTPALGWTPAVTPHPCERWWCRRDPSSLLTCHLRRVHPGILLLLISHPSPPRVPPATLYPPPSLAGDDLESSPRIVVSVETTQSRLPVSQHRPRVVCQSEITDLESSDAAVVADLQSSDGG
ncbi:hypothetical protein BDZ89DRAFT_1054709 [Hymenopellis radicata]|nr:hypothetical protein BDZ89DRAFT_1054709 [Hymenopellis radicata]